MATITKVNRKKGEAYLIRFTHPKTNKWVRRVVYCSRKEAEMIRKKIDADIAMGAFNIMDTDGPGYSWAELKKKYLKFAQKNKSEGTVERDKNVMDVFEAFLGSDEYSLTAITGSMIEEYKAERLSEGKKEATVGLEMRHLRSIFYQAMKWKMMGNNPVVGVKHPQMDIIKVRYLTKAEIKRLLEAIHRAKDWEFGGLVQAYLNTGARRNELLSPFFTWDNVDFHNRQILVQGKGKRKRYIPMNTRLYGILETLQKDGYKHPFEYKPDYVTRRVQKYYREAGIEGANLHSLRKTFGSLLLQYGSVDLYTVSKLLGHSSVTTTEKYYVDLLDENYRSSVGAMDDILDDVLNSEE
ncbi:MAG: site-specific integrase [Candidatus Marinimicrobia bacterium]|nr:site-specific integrase [Candidatus Neomarinimicrobiota bacterium]